MKRFITACSALLLAACTTPPAKDVAPTFLLIDQGYLDSTYSQFFGNCVIDGFRLSNEKTANSAIHERKRADLYQTRTGWHYINYVGNRAVLIRVENDNDGKVRLYKSSAMDLIDTANEQAAFSECLKKYKGLPPTATNSSATTRGYPKDWPSLIFLGNNDCSDISGIYRLNASKSSEPKNTASTKRLDSMLFIKYLADMSSEAKAQLLYLKADNKITLSLDPKIPSTLKGYRTIQGAATCKEGWIELNASLSGSSEGTSKTSRTFTKLKLLPNGSLVAYNHTIRHSSSFFIKFNKSEEESWHIFEKVK